MSSSSSSSSRSGSSSSSSSSSTKSLKDQRKDWEDDSASTTCRKCKISFTVVNRRHHCRCCGKIFCGECTKNKVVLPDKYGYGESPQRCCGKCVTKVSKSNGGVLSSVSKIKNAAVSKVTGSGVSNGLDSYPRLDVVALRGCNLNAADLGGKSDPYCVLKIGPNKCKTKVINGTLEPEWRENMTIPIVNFKKDELLVTVKDHDLIGGSDSLGTFQKKLSKFDLVQGVPKVFIFGLKGGDVGENIKELAKQSGTKVAAVGAKTAATAAGGKAAGTAAGMIAKSQVKGKVGQAWYNHGTVAISLTLRHFPDDRKESPLIASKVMPLSGLSSGMVPLRIHLHGAAKLNTADILKSDPYCVISLGPDRSWRSKTKRVTLNPYWDQIFAFPVSLVELVNLNLNVHVFDNDLIGKDDSLGTGTYPLGPLQLGRNSEITITVKLSGGDIGENLSEIADRATEKAAGKAIGINLPVSHKVKNHGVVCLSLFIPA